MFDFDIDALVQETMKAVHVHRGLNPFKEDSSFIQAQLPDQVPGVLFNLEKKSSTFVIRVFASKNLAEDYSKIIVHPENYPTLRLLSDDEKSIEQKLHFFECDSFLLAELIKKELGNKRFPIHEEHVFNVSDPGDSWWLKRERNCLKIYFKLSRTESMDSLIKIGPLGDGNEAMEMFNKLYGYFQMLFPVADYSSAHGQFCVRCEREHDPIFNSFVELFTEGNSGHEFWGYLRDLEVKSQTKPYIQSLKRANLFLMEIACLRRFWMEIQDLLED